MRSRPFGAAVIACLLLTHQGATARTWRILADGTGDAPFLEAGMDSAAAGDTVLVAPGNYVIGPIAVVGGIVLRSEAGPLQTKLLGFPGVDAGLACSQLRSPTEICGFWFEGFDDVGFTGEGAISAAGCYFLTIRECVFSNNAKAGVGLSANESLWLENNTFVGNSHSVYSTFVGTGAATNNIFWDPVVGANSFNAFCNDVLHLADIPIPWRIANFSADPQFCGEHDYRVLTTSPCASGNTPLSTDCGLVGALPAECTPTRVEARSWGAVKALYRN